MYAIIRTTEPVTVLQTCSTREAAITAVDTFLGVAQKISSDNYYSGM